MNNFKGVIIEESLDDRSVLDDIKIIDTKVEKVTEKHQTPRTDKWTLHTVEVSGDQAADVAEKLSASLDSEQSWYADFKNDDVHYIVFRGRVFKVDRSSESQYKKVITYGLTLGIPDYQLDFSPTIKQWER